jgi:sulfur transfer protein SufE
LFSRPSGGQGEQRSDEQSNLNPTEVHQNAADEVWGLYREYDEWNQRARARIIEFGSSTDEGRQAFREHTQARSIAGALHFIHGLLQNTRPDQMTAEQRQQLLDAMTRLPRDVRERLNAGPNHPSRVLPEMMRP